MEYFSNNIDKFIEFHQKDNHTVFLDTKEEQDAHKGNLSRGIIEEYCLNNHIIKAEEIKRDEDKLKEIVELLTEGKMSHREIGDLFEISSSTIHRMGLRIKDGD